MGPYDRYKWSEITSINGRKKIGNWSYNPTCGSYDPIFKEFSNIALEHTPDPEPTVYVSEFLAFGGERGGLGYAPGVCWGSLRHL